MSVSSPDIRGPVYFCYANPVGFSGQKMATELVIQGLRARGWDCRSLHQPVLDRGRSGGLAVPRYMAELVAAWWRALSLVRSRGGSLCVNLGLTRAGLLRDSIPLLMGRIGLGRSRLVISLHASLFLYWRDSSIEARMLRILTGMAGTVTALGEKQRARLLALGVPAERIVTVINSCGLEPISALSVAAKHSRSRGSDRTVRMLHLSSLIDTKGYPEYLDALLRMAELRGPKVDAVLCGRLVASEYSSGRVGEREAEKWIVERIEGINRTERVRVRWVRGAIGSEKAALFRKADLFVLPTRYAVEAQPLVLLEAMASGCAIVTTSIGEIPTILDPQCAALIGSATVDDLVPVLQELADNPTEMYRLARASHERFVERYRISRHIDAWENIIGALNGARGRQR